MKQICGFSSSVFSAINPPEILLHTNELFSTADTTTNVTLGTVVVTQRTTNQSAEPKIYHHHQQQHRQKPPTCRRKQLTRPRNWPPPTPSLQTPQERGEKLDKPRKNNGLEERERDSPDGCVTVSTPQTHTLTHRWCPSLGCWWKDEPSECRSGSAGVGTANKKYTRVRWGPQSWPNWK